MGKKSKKKIKTWLPINLIIIGIAGVFLPILPAILLITVGVLLMFPNVYAFLKKKMF